MELLQLRYFCDAAQTQNFSKTAKKYLVPTSNISQSVKRLERELGVELFEHKANKIVLAEAGKRFYEKARLALDTLDEAKREAIGSDVTGGGEIKLLVFCNRRLVMDAIEAFKKDHPRVSFVIRHELEADIDYDILISDQNPHGYSEKYILAEDDILVAIGKDNPLAKKHPLSARDLRTEQFITMPKGRSLYLLTNSICLDAGFTPSISILTDDPSYIRKQVELGLGIAFIPSCSWKGLFSDKVELRSIGDIKRTTYVFLPQVSKRRPEIYEFLKCLGIKSDSFPET